MALETKLVREEVFEYLNFGWVHTEDTSVRSGRSSHTEHVLARDTNRPNYRLIVALERKYFALRSQLKTYQPMDGWLSVLLFLLFIVPFVLYLLIKQFQKTNIEEHNAEIRRQMRKVLDEVKPLVGKIL